jgi:hypothetical protein
MTDETFIDPDEDQPEEAPPEEKEEEDVEDEDGVKDAEVPTE